MRFDGIAAPLNESFFQVRKTCVEILPGYPSQEFVVVTLHTLTLLSAHTLVDIPDQVKG
jgi:integrator complex subunit 7